VRGSPSIAVVIPAGPNDDVADTVDSVLRYTERPRLVVVVDDSGRDIRSRLKAASPDVEVIVAPRHARGAFGGLYLKIAAGYRYAVSRFDFDVLLRLDADALVIGPGVAELAVRRFADDPRTGMLGSYRIGPDGGVRSWVDAATTLCRECGVRGLDRPRMRGRLRSLFRDAVRNGYVPGEHALGGAYFHSAKAVNVIQQRGMLDLSALRHSRLGEDHLFSLITVASGFRIADFGGPHDPLALKWKGLPNAPAELLSRGKLVTHSVRSWGQVGEREIRRLFADSRHGNVDLSDERGPTRLPPAP
jgi:hypothetical protein